MEDDFDYSFYDSLDTPVSSNTGALTSQEYGDVDFGPNQNAIQDEFYRSLGLDPSTITDAAPATTAEVNAMINGTSVGNWWSQLGTAAQNAFKKPDGSYDMKKILTAGGGLYGLYQSQRPQDKTGYLGTIPKYEAVREQVANTYDPNRRPGSAAQTYFTNTKYVAPENAGAARAAAVGEAAGLEALNKANPAQQSRPVLQAGAIQTQPTSLVAEDAPVPQYAAGGITGLPKSKAKTSKGRYLNGETDGMADKIPAKIDGKQEARLSHGEFVIPADVVGHLGNGNSEAGAKRLYEMMDRIRHARTGTTKQGKQINSDKFLPK
jgi:hypothetical protein